MNQVRNDPSRRGLGHGLVVLLASKLRCPGFLSLLLVMAALLVFLPVRHADFVNYDDPDYVTANLHVQTGLTWNNIAWAFTTGHASNWHPLTWLSHMVDYQFFGSQAGPQHLVSAAFHLANTLLVFWVFRLLTGALWRSALVAALFALHPLHVESVAWISERKDVLSAFFFLLTIWAYAISQMSGVRCQVPGARDHGSGIRGRRSRVVYYLLAMFFFAFGLMSKPMLVTVPFVLLLLDYWPLRRFAFTQADSPADRIATSSVGLSMGFLLVEKIPFLGLALVSSWVTYLVQRHGGAVSTSLSLGGRIANALISYVRYLGKTFWPFNLSVLYPHPGHWPGWEVLSAAALLLLISGLVVVLGPKRPYLAVGWFWFCGMLVPVIGLIQVGVQSMADRYTYIPLLGLLLMVVWGGYDLMAIISAKLKAARAASQPKPKPQPKGSVPEAEPVELSANLNGVAGFLVAVVLIACGLLTSRQLHYWRNSEALFNHAVNVTTANYLAYNNLGFFLSEKGKTAEALENYRKSLEINPQYEDALNNMGYALASQKKFNEAIALYQAALRTRPMHPEVHDNLGNALSEIGQIDEAIKHYRITLTQVPEHADAHNNLGIALAMKGQFDEAIFHFHQAIRFKPNNASAHSNLGNAMAVQHKLAEATQEYAITLRLKPDDAQAHNNLGNVLAEQGRLAEAVGQYQEALRLNADNPEAHFNLGMALERQGERDAAREHYQKALQLKPDYAEAKRQLELLSAPATR